MSQDIVEECIAKVQALPLAEQAACLMLAAQRCEAQLRRWCQTNGAPNPLPDFSACFTRWQAGQASDEELEAAAEPVDSLLPFDIDDQEDPPAAMAVQALSSVAAVALDLVPDMPGEILRSGVFFAATSFCEGRESPIEIDADCLSDAERQFVLEWWDECRRSFEPLSP